MRNINKDRKANSYSNYCNFGSPVNQSGNATLAMSLVILAVVTVVGTTSSKTATNEVRMTSNSIEKQKSLIAADDAVTKAWNIVKSFDQMDFLNPCNRPGVYDLRTPVRTTCPTLDVNGEHIFDQNNTLVISSFSNNKNSWDLDPTHWKWDASIHANHHQSLSGMLSTINVQMLTSAQKVNPMKLLREPQFTIGIHDPVYRAGSTQVCFPVSIIGAANGGVEETETLIQIRGIPPNGCFANI